MRNRKRTGASINKKAVSGPVYKLRFPKKLALTVFLISVASLAVAYFPELGRVVDKQKIEVIQVEGNLNYLPEDEVVQSVMEFMHENILTLQLDQIKANLEMNYWIESASLRREWPGKLIIEVSEEVPIARWGNAEILSMSGALFVPGEYSQLMELPMLEGPQASANEVMSQYQTFNKILYPYGLKISEISLNDRAAWHMVLTNGMQVKIGKNKLMEKFGRFVAFIEKLDNDAIARIKTIDLRYSNGLAVALYEDFPENVAAR